MVGGVGLTGIALEIDVGEVDDARERLVLPEQTCGGLTPDRDRDDRIALVKHVRGPELYAGGSAPRRQCHGSRGSVRGSVREHGEGIAESRRERRG